MGLAIKDVELMDIDLESLSELIARDFGIQKVFLEQQWAGSQAIDLVSSKFTPLNVSPLVRAFYKDFWYVISMIVYKDTLYAENLILKMEDVFGEVASSDYFITDASNKGIYEYDFNASRWGYVVKKGVV